MDDEQEKKALLQTSRLFKSFSSDVIDAILPLLTFHTYDAGNLICLKGDDSDSLYIIRDGSAEVTVTSSEGKVILLGLLSKGDVCGEVGLIDKETRTANVIAHTDLTLYRLNSEDFNKITQRFGVDEWMALTSYICFLFRGVTNNLEETVFLDAGVRIAYKIQNLYEKSGDKESNSFNIEISQENLGRMAGLSREAANKVLSKLEDQGLIELQYKRIIVPDMKKFQAILEEE